MGWQCDRCSLRGTGPRFFCGVCSHDTCITCVQGHRSVSPMPVPALPSPRPPPPLRTSVPALSPRCLHHSIPALSPHHSIPPPSVGGEPRALSPRRMSTPALAAVGAGSSPAVSSPAPDGIWEPGKGPGCASPAGAGQTKVEYVVAQAKKITALERDVGLLQHERYRKGDEVGRLQNALLESQNALRTLVEEHREVSNELVEERKYRMELERDLANERTTRRERELDWRRSVEAARVSATEFQSRAQEEERRVGELEARLRESEARRVAVEAELSRALQVSHSPVPPVAASEVPRLTVTANATPPAQAIISRRTPGSTLSASSIRVNLPILERPSEPNSAPSPVSPAPVSPAVSGMFPNLARVMNAGQDDGFEDRKSQESISRPSPSAVQPEQVSEEDREHTGAGIVPSRNEPASVSGWSGGSNSRGSMRHTIQEQKPVGSMRHQACDVSLPAGSMVSMRPSELPAESVHREAEATMSLSADSASVRPSEVPPVQTGLSLPAESTASAHQQPHASWSPRKREQVRVTRDLRAARLRDTGWTDAMDALAGELGVVTTVIDEERVVVRCNFQEWVFDVQINIIIRTWI